MAGPAGAADSSPFLPMNLFRSFVATCCSVVLSVPTPAQDVDPGTSYVFKLAGPLPPARYQLLRREFDLLERGPQPNTGSVSVVVMPGAELARFRGLFPGAVLIERGRPFAQIAAERAAGSGGIDVPDANYYTTAEIEQEIDALVAGYPSLARKVDLTGLPGASRTHANNPIWALEVSDNVAIDEDEPAIVIAAQHHARELNAPHIVIGAMRRVLQGYANDPQLRAVVDGKVLWFVPCVNPDGVDWVWSVDNFWRKNRRNNGDGTFGVDLNRNYPTRWGGCGASSNTSSQTYKGPSAASEPETRTMRALVARVRPEIYLDFHSSGREVLFPIPPCGSVGASVGSMLWRYVDDLRRPMSFASRPPSASGEAPEDHWSSGGALGFLTEIGRSFQPVFSSTVAEEARVWPGVRRALTGWAPAVRGHVRSIYRGEPVEAEIRFVPSQFPQGERTTSRASDGRFGLWLPLGSWQVTVSAPGFVSTTTSVVVTGYDQPIALDVDLIPAWPQATLTLGGSVRIGTTTTLTYSSPGDAGLDFWIALSGGTAPGVTLGSRTLPLNADAFFEASIAAAPLLVGNLGVLPPTELASASLNLPRVPALVGVSFFAAGITFESGYPSSVKRWSSPVSMTILP